MAAAHEGTRQTAIPSPYPAPNASTSATIASIPTTATRISFSDKILLTVTQAGRLNHWIHVPLSAVSPTDSSLLQPSIDPDDPAALDSTLLPYTQLTATTVLGGTKSEFETLGQTLATTLASAVIMRSPGEHRMLVLGLGLMSADMGSDEFEGLIGLCLEVL